MERMLINLIKKAIWEVIEELLTLFEQLQNRRDEMGENRNQGPAFTPEQEARIREIAREAVEAHKANVLDNLERMRQEQKQRRNSTRP